MDEKVKGLLAKRRDRAIATLLGFKEREADPFLKPETRGAFRKVILDQINDFYDLTLDIVSSLDNGSVELNQIYMDRIDAIYTTITSET